MVLAHQVDCALVAWPPPGIDADAPVEHTAVFTEPLLLALPTNHPPVHTPQDLQLDTLAAFGNGCTYRRMGESFLQQKNGSPPRVLELASYHAILACVAAGRRRVTLFAPEQIDNLYIGPLDFTPAGQAISLVDFAAPDLQRFPRFAQALAHAQVAELGPGDAVFIPSLWWHHMEGLDTFNVLVNYWWRPVPAWMDAPMNALMLAMLALRELPPHQREQWRTVFDHYVFHADPDTAAHVPVHARGVLGALDANTAAQVRSVLRRRLER